MRLTEIIKQLQSIQSKCNGCDGEVEITYTEYSWSGSSERTVPISEIKFEYWESLNECDIEIIIT